VLAQALAALADRQWRDYGARTPGTCFADPRFTLDLQQAYDLQQAVTALRVAAGDRIVGYKVGCTGPGTVAQFGMEGPIWGCRFESEIHSDGGAIDAGAYAHLAIEGEMALTIGEDGEVAAVFPVIELHHFVFRAPRKTLAELVANNGLNAGIVLPNDAWLRTGKRLASDATLSVQINGHSLGTAGLWPLAGGPTASLAWLRDRLGDRGLALMQGQIVLAGTPIGLYPVRTGDHVAVLIDDQSVVQCLLD
jgi:2-keto-4-pentenoate hydratase